MPFDPQPLLDLGRRQRRAAAEAGGVSTRAKSRSHVNEAIPYVQNQKRRHAANKLWPGWEPTDD